MLRENGFEAHVTTIEIKNIGGYWKYRENKAHSEGPWEQTGIAVNDAERTEKLKKGLERQYPGAEIKENND